MTVANVMLWGRTIGAVSWDDDRQFAHFEYDPAFIDSAIEVAPVMMPLSERIYSFPALPRITFHGLPGLLADSLPDRFGNALIDTWLAKEGRDPASFNPVERLCYTGTRGMGALEFSPALGPSPKHGKAIDVQSLVDLASEILTQRSRLEGSFMAADRAAALQDILRVGTSAGGARAKAIIAWNPETNTVRSGQVGTGKGFSYWLLKFDGVSGNRDKELEDPRGYGLIEYAYSLMARAAGIEMSECRLLQEYGRNHFMARRFDRTDTGQKLHMQSLCALCHYDFNQAGAYSYEQALQAMRALNLPMSQIEEQYRRMVFNIIARNQDDHVKNIAFLMDKTGTWSLSPAFDMTYSYNPTGQWTSTHQMTLNGKRDDFQLDDFVACEKFASMKRGLGLEILTQVQAAVMKWTEFAETAGVPAEITQQIAATHRTGIVSG
jgi:serine/threonine-protein kinase HipA